MKPKKLVKNKLDLLVFDYNYFGGQPSKKNQIAYCHNKTHKGYLSEKILKQHECLRKNCPFLQKFEDHPFWIDRQKRKEQKKQNKQNQKPIEERYRENKIKKELANKYYKHKEVPDSLK